MSVDESLWTKNYVEIYNKNETKLTEVPYSFFFLSSKRVKIARLAIQQNLINLSYQRIKKKESKKITLFS